METTATLTRAASWLNTTFAGLDHSILFMLAVYSILIKCDVSVQATMAGFGLAVALSMCYVIFKHRRNQREFDSLHLIGEQTRSDNH